MRHSCILRGAIPLLSLALSGSPQASGDPVRDACDLTLPDHTTIPYDFFTLLPALPVEPVLTKYDVTDTYAAFVADPFLIHHEDSWYMFFEVWAYRGKIGLATSADGLHWTYDRIVLSDGFHHSFPCVFRCGEEIYMVVESGETETVPLYRADPFPHTWVHERDLIEDRALVDPSLFQYDGSWWMFVGGEGSADCYLFYADDLPGPWVEHPQSPIVRGNRGKARPAGRAVVFDGDRLVRLAQKCDVHYGEAVRAFEVLVLTRTLYVEEEVAQSPILRESDAGWNRDGMHQCDPWWVGDHWIAAVDGLQGIEWAIGIYRTPRAAGAEEEIGSSRATDRERLRSYPNPSLGEVTIEIPPAPPGAGGKGRLSVGVPSGEVVRRWVLPLPRGGSAQSLPGAIRWDGRDGAGRALPAGVYLLAWTVPGHRYSSSVTIVR